jgi:hypothetical protein
MHAALLVSSPMAVLSSIPTRKIQVSPAACPQHGQETEISGQTLVCVLASDRHMQCSRVYDSIATIMMAAFLLHTIDIM